MEKTLIDLLLKQTNEDKAAIQNGIIDKDVYGLQSNSIVKIRKMIGEKSIGLKTHARFVPFPKHNHDYVEVIYVCSGSITHHLDKQVLCLHEGSLLFLNKAIYHSIENTGENDLGINILLSDDFISQLLPKLSKQSIITQFLMRSLNKQSTPEFLHYWVGDNIPMQGILSNLVYSLSGNHHINPTIIPDNFALLLNYLTLYDEALKNSTLFQNQEDLFIIYVNEYINNNYRTATLVELAKNTGYSEGYLSRYIKKLFGKTFVTILKEKRISVAEELLLTTSMSIHEIINQVGYDNRFYFNEMFKEKYGMSPLKWKKHRHEEKK
ncbi:MAG: AraC family transcriptional regulator [Erysipelotrichia bacterium]|nr:AraC family transcriptional regulator [Erysipelotrichia bacterium]